jgi:hypothetical protein
MAQLMADEGPSLEAVKAGARGRYKPRTKRMTHLTVVLAERQEGLSKTWDAKFTCWVRLKTNRDWSARWLPKAAVTANCCKKTSASAST